MIQEQIQKIKTTAQYDDTFYLSLDEAIEALQKAKEVGENIYIDYNSKELYSFIDDEKSCYNKVYGMSKERLQQKQKRQAEIAVKKQESSVLKEEKEKLKLLNQVSNKLPTWISEGEKYIYPQASEAWKNLVLTCLDNPKRGLEIEYALKIFSRLENQQDKNRFIAAECILQSAVEKGADYYMVLDTVFEFAKRGPQFYRLISQKDVYQNQIGIMLSAGEKERRNQKYECEIDERE